MEKSKDTSRALLFGLLANCIFSTGINESCPLSELRINLSIEEKYEFVMGLSDEEIKNILVQHDKCYEKRLSSLQQD
ncbi:hypothetical protein ACFLZ5_05405 [Thermodesulfobacteriota bacterium]